MDCGCLWVKNSSFLVDSQSTKSDIMRNRSPASSTSTNVAPVIDYKDWQIALSRRFKVLKLWTVIRKHGYSGLMYHIRSDVNMAKRFEAMVAKDERFETVEPRKCALVCFRLKPKRESDGSELNRRLVDALNASGRAFFDTSNVGWCLCHTLLHRNHAHSRPSYRRFMEAHSGKGRSAVVIARAREYKRLIFSHWLIQLTNVTIYI